MRLRLLILVFGLPLGLLRRRAPRPGAGALESSAGGQP